MAVRGMIDRQKRFVEEYLVDLCGTKDAVWNTQNVKLEEMF
jgi:hypothetical protein